MHWESYQDLHFSYKANAPVKRQYSITSDVLSYQLCPTQYALYRIRKYEASMTNQMFYGTIIHQVLDRAHMHFKGVLDSSKKGTLPTDDEIDQYFNEVDSALKARRISAGTPIKHQALEVIKRFNRIEGPSLYPRVKNTECRLQADKGDYILNGNVDVLAVSPTDPNAVEIWDYKGSYSLAAGDPRLKQYRYQMQVYAELYRRRTGVMPQRAVIYFLNTLSGEVVPKSRPRNAVVEVPINSDTVDMAIDNFSGTVGEIEESRANGIWKQPNEQPPAETCNICDLRWSCSFSEQCGHMRYP